ncbi:toxin-antitoxin system YwqK family antitoxin [Geojedonia litorea]|uniref:Toxin-antitoxin system YwqK family antitoxin n=1 Tax=Geojedonia litorea TaxID=1268269 RepID=A0ABV9N490_9FLAO
MKKLILILLMFSGTLVFAQNKVEPQFEKDGDLTMATYFYENGNIEQQGTFNSEGKLHGEWVSYDVKGNKLSVGQYENGLKIGKWLFWQAGVKKEVEYKNSKITGVKDSNQ